MLLIDLVKNGKFNKVNVSNSTELFKSVFKDLIRESYVTEDFLDEIIRRESEFPTGIKTATMSISLPHVDSIYVKKNALIICSCYPPIEFNQMDNVSNILDVKLAFILLIKEPMVHMQTLARLTKIWQNSSLLDFIYRAEKVEEVLTRLLLEDDING